MSKSLQPFENEYDQPVLICGQCSESIRDGSTYCHWQGAPAHPDCYLKARADAAKARSE